MGAAGCQWSAAVRASGSSVILKNLPQDRWVAGPAQGSRSEQPSYDNAAGAAVTDELILAAVHTPDRPPDPPARTSRPELSLHGAGTGSHSSSARSCGEKSPNLEPRGSSKAGLMTERPKASQQRRHCSSQSRLAKSRTALTVLACAFV